jgi:hypothetical protein
MLSGRIHVWYQPALRLGSPSGEVLGSEGLGVGGSLGARFFPLEKVGLVLELGYKSSGFVAGEPLAAGILLRAGLAFRGDAAAF